MPDPWPLLSHQMKCTEAFDPEWPGPTFSSCTCPPHYGKVGLVNLKYKRGPPLRGDSGSINQHRHAAGVVFLICIQIQILQCDDCACAGEPGWSL